MTAPSLRSQDPPPEGDWEGSDAPTRFQSTAHRTGTGPERAQGGSGGGARALHPPVDEIITVGLWGWAAGGVAPNQWPPLSGFDAERDEISFSLSLARRPRPNMRNPGGRPRNVAMCTQPPVHRGGGSSRLVGGYSVFARTRAHVPLWAAGHGDVRL